jgi:hypothetical protein
LQSQKLIASSRVEKMARSSLRNAAQAGAKFFLNYAGHTKTFDYYNHHMTDLTGFRDWQFIQAVALEEGLGNLEVLDMVPGDTFNFISVEKHFGIRLDDSILKEESVSYYRSYGIDKRCDSYRLPIPDITVGDLIKMIEEFLLLLYKFIQERVKTTQFRTEIMDQCVSIACDELQVHRMLQISNGSISIGDNPLEKCTIFDIPIRLLVPILRGELSLENILIGGQCKMYKYPLDFHNGAVIFWMSMFSYVYLQRYACKETSIS